MNSSIRIALVTGASRGIGAAVAVNKVAISNVAQLGVATHTLGGLSITADKLDIAASTVEVHRRNIMRKLDLHSVAELTRYVDSHALPDRRHTDR